jgi:hypothetical protein
MEFLRKIRIEMMIFLILFITYSYFNQGGGWAQNSRFAQVRSIVETGQFEINNYVLYRFVADGNGKTELRRLPLPPGLQLEQISLNASTGDISLFQGRLYPNKPPGTVLTAVPIYFAIYWIERALGIDPDDWWPLTINAYLTTVFSVGLLTALGCVVFYRISLRLFPLAPAWAHAASTMTFGTGTLIFPFATMMYDHNVVAALSLLSFWMLLIDKDSGFKLLHRIPVLFGAGFISGLAVVMNYSSVIFFGLLTLYAAWTNRSRWDSVLFLSGAVLPLIFLVWYHAACFGSVLASASTYQNEIFQGKEMLLFGMFGLPQFDVMIKLLFSSYRGLFFTSPVLALSCIGFWLMATHYKKHAEVALFAAIFIGFLLMNSSFLHWHSGWSIGPRYLIPALPFLAIPLTLVFEKLPRTTLALAALSSTIMLLATAVDPQPPVEIQNPFIHYILPLLRGEGLILSAFGNAIIHGPVSANPMGVYESWFYPVFHPEIVQQQWNSFNLGEFFWPGSLVSLLPLCCVLVLGLGALGYWSRQSVTDAPEPPMSTR